MTRTTLKIDGMSCGHCVAAVSRALDSLEGVQVETVAIGTVTVDHDASVTPVQQITDAITEAGYSATPAN